METDEMASNASGILAGKAIKKEKDCQLAHLHSTSTEFHEVAVKTEPLQSLQAEIERSDITPAALIPQLHECIKAELILEDEIAVKASQGQNHNQDILETAVYQQAQIIAEDSETWKGSRGSYKKAFRQRLLCDLCPLSFTNEDYMRNHRATHAKDKKRFRCQACGKTFSTKGYFLTHIKTHPGDTHNPQMRKNLNITLQDSVTCGVCNKIFTKAHIAVHMRVAHSKNTIKCEYCPRSFKNTQSLRKHKVTHDQGRMRHFTCQSCGRAFYTKGSLVLHMRTHPGDIHNYHMRPYKCVLCQQAFKQKRSLKDHLKLHGNYGKGEFACHLCSKKLASHAGLQIHIRLHTGDTFKCQFCEVRYTQKSNLKVHMRDKHSGEIQQFGAGSLFSNKAPVHMKTKWISDEEFLHEGLGADSAQVSQQDLTITPDVSVTCEVCCKIFTKELIEKHMRLAHSEKPNKCEFCHRSFTNMAHFMRHRVTHDKDRKREISCLLCGRAFYTKGNLVEHMKTHTRKQNVPEKQQGTPGPQPSKDVSVLTKTELMSDEEFLDEDNRADSAQRSQPSARIGTPVHSVSCGMCNKSFNKEFIESHMRVAHNKDALKCEFCRISFKTVGILNRHRRTHASLQTLLKRVTECISPMSSPT